ncbi:MAG: hypothetical protein PVI94_22810, partial [Desulfobacterales bacterium]
MVAISQASVLVGDRRSLKMWDNKASARINPIDGRRCMSNQLRFKTLKPFKEKARTKDTAHCLFMVYVF